MTSLSGDRLSTNRYIKHPAAASSYWGDGAALDAGMAMVIDSNLNWLVEQSCRHLVADTNAGAGADLASKSLVVTSWQDLFNNSIPDANAVDTAHEISWEPAFARCYGPFIFVADRVLSATAGVTLREVVVSFDYVPDATTSSYLNLYAAISPSDSSPDLATPWITTKNQVTTSAGGAQTRATITLTTTQALDAPHDGTSLVTRASASNAQLVGKWLVGYLWVGWVTTKINPGDASSTHVLYSVSGWEKR